MILPGKLCSFNWGFVTYIESKATSRPKHFKPSTLFMYLGTSEKTNILPGNLSANCYTHHFLDPDGECISFQSEVTFDDYVELGHIKIY